MTTSYNENGYTDYPRGGIMIPLYLYPDPSDGSATNPYTVCAALTVPAIIIMNPSSGAGASSAPNSDWSWAITTLAAKKTVGYVPTTFGARDYDAVIANIDGYVDNSWGVTGFHFDEVANSETYLNYYSSIVAYVRNKYPTYLVSFNPGVVPPVKIAMLPDLCTVYENDDVDDLDKPSWFTKENKAKWRAIAHPVSGSANALAQLQLMQDKNIYWKFVTDVAYTTSLPTYLTDVITWLNVSMIP